MLVGVDVNQKIEFICKSDNSEPKTIFIFKPLSGADMLSLGAMEGGISASGVINFLDLSIVDIKNIKEGVKKLDFIKSLSMESLSELLNKANEINGFNKDDEKNS